MKIRKIEQDDVTCYMPSEKLVNHLKQQLHRIKQIESGREPEEGARGERKRRRNKNENLNRMKFHYLDSLFQAMADLKFFFEVIAKQPQLERYYGDDIMDLLGIRRKEPSNGKTEPCGFVFYDLLSAILKVGEFSSNRNKGMQAKVEVRPEDKVKARAKAEAEAKANVEAEADFRLILNHLAEKIVRKKVSASLPSGYASMNAGREFWLANEEDFNVHKVILADLGRALAWTRMLASRIGNSPEHDEKPHRTFDFDAENLLSE
jgi:hypothetical protein